MTEAKLNYVGPIPKALTFERGQKAWWRKVPLAFLIIVLLPTVIAVIYYLFIASPRYVSEARFIVRSAGQNQPSAVGIALQGVGLSATQTDAFAVHEYITSRDGLDDLSRRFDVESIIGLPGVDGFSRYPRPWESQTDEGLYKGFQRFVTIGYDSTTGISTLRVEAFRARDAKAVAEEMLNGGERLVNRLNVRAAADAVAGAEVTQELARERLTQAQQRMTAFRNREQFISPELSANEGAQLIGGLLATVATLKAERAQIAAEASSSPQLPVLDSRINAYERQIAAERAKIAGNAGSLAPKIGAYEDLALNRELADQDFARATASLVAAQQDARRQKLYLERIVSPSLPDEPSLPRRWLAILTVFASAMLAYGVIWLIWSGVREHRQA